jgi:hypothetical protein
MAWLPQCYHSNTQHPTLHPPPTHAISPAPDWRTRRHDFTSGRKVARQSLPSWRACPPYPQLRLHVVAAEVMAWLEPTRPQSASRQQFVPDPKSVTAPDCRATSPQLRLQSSSAVPAELAGLPAVPATTTLCRGCGSYGEASTDPPPIGVSAAICTRP